MLHSCQNMLQQHAIATFLSVGGPYMIPIDVKMCSNMMTQVSLISYTTEVDMPEMAKALEQCVVSAAELQQHLRLGREWTPPDKKP